MLVLYTSTDPGWLSFQVRCFIEHYSISAEFNLNWRLNSVGLACILSANHIQHSLARWKILKIRPLKIQVF